MPSITIPIGPHGPIIEFMVGLSLPRSMALKEAGLDAPNPISLRGLIDTGASVTCIDPEALLPLSLVPTGTMPIVTPSTGNTPHLCNQYDVGIMIYHPEKQIFVFNMPIIESRLRSFGYDALVGRDVLEKCLLVYNGADATCTLSF